MASAGHPSGVDYRFTLERCGIDVEVVERSSFSFHDVIDFFLASSFC